MNVDVHDDGIII